GGRGIPPAKHPLERGPSGEGTPADAPLPTGVLSLPPVPEAGARRDRHQGEDREPGEGNPEALPGPTLPSPRPEVRVVPRSTRRESPQRRGQAVRGHHSTRTLARKATAQFPRGQPLAYHQS